MGLNNGTLSVNGTVKATGTLNNAANVVRAQNKIGANHDASANFFNGNLAEILLFNRPLTQNEQDDVRSYLTWKYQLLSQTIATPMISVASGTLSGPTQVAISAEDDASIYYTLDGSTPSALSTLYTAPLNIAYTQTLKAIAVRNGISSSVATATYTLNSTEWPAPSTSGGAPEIHLTLPSTAIP